jgi:general secretion pathway protein L
MTPTRIVLLPHTPDAAALSLVVADGRVIERAELAADPIDPPEPLPCVLIVPGTEALARWLALPVRTEAQAGPAAAILLEEQLATPRDRSHLALGAPEDDGQRLVVVVDRAVLDGWIEQATSLGVFPDVVLPDHLALPEQAEDALVVRFGDTYALRGNRLALSCEPDLLPLVVGERPWREITDVAEIEGMLAAAAAAPRINLLQTAPSVAAPTSSWRQLRAAAILLGLLAISPLALSAANIVKHDAAAREVDRRTDARVRAALPSAEPIVNPGAQLQARIERLSSGGQFPLAAAALFTALQRSNGMELDALTFEPDRPMRATVSYRAPGDLELFRAAAQQAGFRTESTGALSLGGRYVSEVTLSRAS